jgi:hypothetical protein
VGRFTRAGLLLVALALVLPGCALEPPRLVPVDLTERRLQTRRFETRDEQTLIRASAAVLQDLGFILDSDETDLGVLVGSKNRTAVEVQQEIVAFIALILTGASVPTDRDQKISVSLVTRPAPPGGVSTLVRVTFHRTVWNDKGMVTRMEQLDEPHFYLEFFTLLSKAVDLEAHDVD